MNTNDLIFTKDNEGNIISGGYNINSLFIKNLANKTGGNGSNKSLSTLFNKSLLVPTGLAIFDDSSFKSSFKKKSSKKNKIKQEQEQTKMAEDNIFDNMFDTFDDIFNTVFNGEHNEIIDEITHIEHPKQNTISLKINEIKPDHNISTSSKDNDDKSIINSDSSTSSSSESDDDKSIINSDSSTSSSEGDDDNNKKIINKTNKLSKSPELKCCKTKKTTNYS